jgi:hypothetical protein
MRRSLVVQMGSLAPTCRDRSFAKVAFAFFEANSRAKSNPLKGATDAPDFISS